MGEHVFLSEAKYFPRISVKKRMVLKKKKNHGSANSLLLNQWLKASVSQAALVPESWNCTALGDRAQH